MDDPELPSPEHELTRKCLDEVARLFADHQAAKLSKRELELCLASIWNCTGGLTTRGFFDVVTAASQEITSMPADEPSTSFMVDGDRLVIVHWQAGMPEVRIGAFTSKGLSFTSKPFDEELRPEEAAARFCANTRHLLIKQGLQPVGAN